MPCEIGLQAVRDAEANLHVREDSPNWGRFVSVYLKFVGIFTPAPWCAAFVAYRIHTAAQKLGKRANWPKTGAPAAHCSTLYRWAKERDLLIGRPEPGCVFLLKHPAHVGRFIHTGLVVRVQAGVIETVEGNTNTNGSPEGIGVFRRVRAIHDCAFVQVGEKGR
jgi:hypothetical protein